MGWHGASEVIFITLNYNITIVGKVWMVLMGLLRILVLFVAGYPLYLDEQERFICNTIQPGCVNVCYDIFAPLSLFRFWLVQFTSVCLPSIVFIVYVIHKVTLSLPAHSEILQQKIVHEASRSIIIGRIPLFIGTYIFHLFFRILLEASFGVAHYLLFGFNIPRRFMCQHAPCTTMVDCYVSRPTEKTITLNFMLGMAALSLLLTLFDFICAIHESVRQKKKMVGNMFEEDRYCFTETELRGGIFGNPENHCLLPSESFQKRISKASDNASTHIVGHPAGPHGGPNLGSNPGVPVLLNGNEAGGYLVSHDEAIEYEGSEVALCMNEPSVTPRFIKVNKCSHLKPLTPPRQDKPSSVASSPKQRGQYKLPGMSTDNGVLSSRENGCNKRKEWV